MGAMQAQDYNMVKWALGIRLPGSRLGTIEDAIEDGSIIRTHLLRPTWHFVAAEDLRWMLELTTPHIKSAMRSRLKQLGLSKSVLTKSKRVIERALSDGKQITRKQLVADLENAGFENTDNRASHLLINAELDGLICSGATQGNQYTYVLLEERIPTLGKKLNRDEALRALAHRYFTSHGPASLKDFAWWSGLPVADARSALDKIKADFRSVKFKSVLYWFGDSENFQITNAGSVHLLPAYDEYLISYKTRSVSMAENAEEKAISNNGLFRPVVVVDGQVAGTWKRSKQHSKVNIEVQFFTKPNKTVAKQTEQAAHRYADFLGKELEISWMQR